MRNWSDKASHFMGKYRRPINWLVFLIVLLIAIMQIKAFEWSAVDLGLLMNSWQILLLVALLVPIHWLLEYRKWSVSVDDSYDAHMTLNAFFSGMITGFITPSYLGNFIGRAKVMGKENLRSSIPLTLLGNAAQFTVSIAVGFSGLLISNLNWLNWPIWVGVFPLLFLPLYLFFDRIPFLEKLVKERGYAVGNLNLRIRLLALSFFRFLIFSIQFSLLLGIGSGQWDLGLLPAVWGFYFIITLSPSLFFGKLFVREGVALIYFQYFSFAPSHILMATLFIWLLNNALPTFFAMMKTRKYAH